MIDRKGYSKWDGSMYWKRGYLHNGNRACWDRTQQREMRNHALQGSVKGMESKGEAVKSHLQFLYNASVNVTIECRLLNNFLKEGINLLLPARWITRQVVLPPSWQSVENLTYPFMQPVFTNHTLEHLIFNLEQEMRNLYIYISQVSSISRGGGGKSPPEGSHTIPWYCFTSYNAEC